MKRILALLTIILGLSFASFFNAQAQEPTPSDDEVNAIASQLYCPVCENTPLDVCPTAACHDWRELIRQMLAQGKSSEEIRQYFVDHYGARVLGEPPAAGFNWLIYVVPPAAFLAGVFLLFQAFRLWKRQASERDATGEASAEPLQGKTLDQAYLNRLEEELRKRE